MCRKIFPGCFFDMSSLTEAMLVTILISNMFLPGVAKGLRLSYGNPESYLLSSHPVALLPPLLFMLPAQNFPSKARQAKAKG